MKMTATVAAAALLACAAPAAAADDALTYESVTHCAAFNLLLAQAYGAGDAAASKQTEIAAFKDQAASLMVIATMMGDASTDKVTSDVSAQNQTMMQSLEGDGGSKLVQDNLATCDTMGKAAKMVIDDKMGEKK